MTKLYLSAILMLILLSACDTTPEASRTLHLSPEGLFSASVSEHFALTGNVRGNAELWQLSPKQLLYTWQHTDEKIGILYTAISDDERYALTAEKESLAWWRISDGVLMNVWYLPEISSISLSANGQFALLGLKDKAVYYSLTQGKPIYTFAHDGAVTDVDISASGALAITGSTDANAKLWDLKTGQLKYQWPHKSKLSEVKLSPDDQLALTNEGLGTLHLWKTSNGKLSRQLGPDLITISASAFSANSKYLLTGRISQRIDLWAIKSGDMQKYWRPQKERMWSPSAATILSIAFTEDDRKFYSIASNGYLQLWRK